MFKKIIMNKLVTISKILNYFQGCSNSEVVVKLFYQKKLEENKKKNIFCTNGLQICMDLRIFASFL